MLFEEKLDLFAALLDEQPVDVEGTTPAAHDQRVFPPTEHGRLTTWIGVGGSPESVVRAARYGLPLMLAIIGGDPARFAPYVELYHRALDSSAAGAADRRAFAGPCGRDGRAGARGVLAALQAMRDRIGAERGWPPMSRARVRARDRARLALRRLARDRGAQDRRDGEGARARAST